VAARREDGLENRQLECENHVVSARNFCKLLPTEDKELSGPNRTDFRHTAITFDMA